MTAQELLRLAHGSQVSDIHITVNSPVVFRIHGRLRPLPGESLKPADTAELAKQLMTTEQYQQFLEHGDMDFSYGIHGLARFRINVYKQRGSVGLAIRIVPSHIPSMEDLGLPAIMKDFAGKPQGLLLVTGPTGSGKSTTLASVIDYLNRKDSSHIITLEDPIEFIHDHKQSMVNQREVGLDTPPFPTY